MDKEEFRVKLDQINHLVEQNDYKGAMEVVDSIDWRRVKNVRTLSVVGEIYAANKRYEDSKEIFLLAYHRAPIGKNILYRLIEVSLKTGNIEEAMEYYEEYLQVAPNDSTKYILKYKIYKENKASLPELIRILEDYKNREFTERWSYELAKLYYQAGEKEKCLGICREMSLWFSDGKYVMKAMELQEKLEGKTETDKAAEENAAASQEAAEEMTEEAPEEVMDLEEESEEENSMNLLKSVSKKEQEVIYSESIQNRLSKGIRDIFGKKKNETAEETSEEEIPEEEAEEEEVTEEEVVEEEVTEEEIEEAADEMDEFLNVEDVPSLEEEDGSVKDAFPEEEKPVRPSIKMPELRIPKGIRKAVKDDDIKVPDMPKLNGVGLVDPKPYGEEEEEKEFNLEDAILAAAYEQGIEIPEKEEEEVPTEEEAEEETAYEEESEEEFEEVEEVEEEELPAAEPAKPVKPVGMDTGLFNFQEELRKTLSQEDDENISTGFTLSDTEEKEYVSEPEEEEFETEEEAEEEEASEEIDSLDLIPRENSLTEEEIELFSYMVKVPGMEEQLVNTLCDVQMAAADKTSRTGNIVVMGGKESGKTKLISALIPAICKELKLEATKVAYVFADQINGKKIPEIISKLSSGFLVIEEANQLDKKTVEQLDKAMEFRTDGLTIILEDEKIGMRKFLGRYPKFAKKFTSQISIPVFTNDELVSFAEVYAAENGFTIDQVGMNALYTMITRNQKADEPMSIGQVKELLDAAISRSQGGLLKFKKKRTSEEGLMILTDKDFN